MGNRYSVGNGQAHRFTGHPPSVGCPPQTVAHATNVRTPAADAQVIVEIEPAGPGEGDGMERAVADAGEKLNRPPVFSGWLPSVPPGLTWKALPPGFVGAMGGLVLGSGAAGFILANMPIEMGSAVLLAVGLAGGTAVAGGSVELGARFINQAETSAA